MTEEEKDKMIDKIVSTYEVISSEETKDDKKKKLKEVLFNESEEELILE